MRRFAVLGLGVVFVALMVGALPASGAGAPKILEFGTMAPVTGPYVGATSPIRGIAGGGLPWQIQSGKGELFRSGKLEVQVRGLVLLDGDPVPEAVRGTNPVPTFKAVVSCQTIDANGAASVENVSTPAFPASTSGNASIEAQVSLPDPCIAPIVFVVHGAAGVWFAATGL